MKKFLLLINAQKPNMASVSFACTMAKMANARLIGLFFENVYFNFTENNFKSSYFQIENQNIGSDVKTDIDQAITLFNNECEKQKVHCSFIFGKGEAVNQVVFESRYADLLLVDPDINFYDTETLQPSLFIKKLLAYAESPVLLVPNSIVDIDEVIFSFNGSASSVFAMKLFTYLFPSLKHKNLTVLQVNDKAYEDESKNRIRMLDWLKNNYQSVNYEMLNGSVKEALYTYLFMKQNKLVIMGAYGRNMVSTFFNKSSADPLIGRVDLPFFITHY